MQEIDDILNELVQTVQAVDDPALERAASLVLSADAVFTDGFGRSGLQAKGFAMRLGHLGLNASIVGDLTARAITSRDLLVICSASGASQTLVYHAGKALAIGAKLLVITGTANGMLASMASECICIAAPTKTKSPDAVASVQPMGSLFEQSAGLVLDAIVLKLMRSLKLDSAGMLTRHANLE